MSGRPSSGRGLSNVKTIYRHEFGGYDIRESTIMLELVFQSCEISNELFSFCGYGRIGSFRGRSMNIVNSLGLAMSVSIRLKQRLGESHKNDGPSISGGGVSERVFVGSAELC